MSTENRAELPEFVGGKAGVPSLSASEVTLSGLACGSLIVVFLLALDFWQWRTVKPLIGGLPYWIWYFFLLAILLTVAMVYLSKAFTSGEGVPRAKP